MEYNFREIEKKWQKRWVENKTYQVTEDETKKKFYVLNMFPYPSGAGLHVGHPLGYIASDIYARYKRLQGFNVLNPMGYDAYGLPAEQYAIQTGQHPAITTTDVAVFYRQPAVADARPVRLRLCRDGRNAVQGIVALVVSGHVVGLGLPFYLPQTHDLPHYGRTTDI